MPDVLLKFYTTTKAKASDSTQVPLKDGRFLILTDTHELTYDFNGARLTLGSIEEVASKDSVTNPIDKFYYAQDTGILWRYTAAAAVGEQWKSWKDSSEFDAHVASTILDTNGAHGFKYDAATKTLFYYNAVGDEWLPILTGGFTSYTKTLLASAWDSSNEQDVTVTGLTAYSNGIVGLPQDITDAEYAAATAASLKVVGQTDDTLTIKAMGTVPSIDIPISVVLFVDTIGGGGVSPEIIGDLADLTTTDKTNIVAAINEVNDDKLGIVTTLPTASATYEGTQYLYVGASGGGLVKGTIYECQSDGQATPTYSWVAISSAEVNVATTSTAGIVMPDGDTINVAVDGTINVDDGYKKTFIGTTEAWASMSAGDKAEYEIVTFTDDTSAPFQVVDAVMDGDMDAVTSNAVYDAVVGKQNQKKFRTVVLPSANWVGNVQTVAVAGVLADEDKQLITPVPTNAQQGAYYAAGVMAIGQASNAITFSCNSTPTVNLSVRVCFEDVEAVV